MTLKIIRLYLNKMRYELGASAVFEERSDMACSIKSKNNSTNRIFNLLSLATVYLLSQYSREL